MKLKEIAIQANVSPATVSLVMNNREGVSPSTRSYISGLLTENGYRIKQRKTSDQKRFLLLKCYKHSYLVNGNPGFVNKIIDSIEAECRLKKISLMISTVDFKRITKSDITGLLKTNSLNGLIVLGTELEASDMNVFDDVKQLMVVVDNPLEYENFSCVTMSNQSAIHDVMLRLSKAGHRRIGFLANAMPACNCIARQDSYYRALNELGMERDDELVYRITPSLSGSYEDVLALLKKGVRFPSALVANNDCIALGAMKAFQQYGVSIPKDLSLVGFDGIDYSAVSVPPLSTVKVSCETMGDMAVQLLCTQLEHPEMPPVKIHVTTSFLSRDSISPFDPTNEYPPAIQV